MGLSLDFPLPVTLLFLGVLITTFWRDGSGPVVAGTLVYVGDYLCRAYLYCTGLRLRSRNVVQTVLAVQATILLGHTIGHLLGLVASSGVLPFAIALAALFAAVLVAMPRFMAGGSVGDSSTTNDTEQQEPGVPGELPRAEALTTSVQAKGTPGEHGAEGGGAPNPLDEIDDACGRLAAVLSQTYVLTPRESDVTALALQGMNAQMIAERLCLSPNTVKSHMDRIYKKTGVHTQEELIELARAGR